MVVECTKKLLLKIINNIIRYYATKFGIKQRNVLIFIRGNNMVKINLSKILGEKRITQAELSKATGIRPNTINEWYHEIVERINVEHLDRICEYLECDITDLIEYVPNAHPKTGKHLILEVHGNQRPREKKHREQS